MVVSLWSYLSRYQFSMFTLKTAFLHLQCFHYLCIYTCPFTCAYVVHLHEHLCILLRNGPKTFVGKYSHLCTIIFGHSMAVTVVLQIGERVSYILYRDSNSSLYSASISLARHIDGNSIWIINHS